MGLADFATVASLGMILLGAPSAGAPAGFRFVDTGTHTDLRFGQDSLYRHMTHRDYGRFGAYYGAQVAPDRPLLLHGRWLVMDLSRNPDVSPVRLKPLYDAYAKADPGASIPPPTP